MVSSLGAETGRSSGVPIRISTPRHIYINVSTPLKYLLL